MCTPSSSRSLEATMPASGWASAHPTSSRSQSGSATASLLSSATYSAPSASARRMPTLTAPAKPRFSGRVRSVTSGNRIATSARVPSLEPLSTTISCAGWLWRVSERRQSARRWAPFQLGITTAARATARSVQRVRWPLGGESGRAASGPAGGGSGDGAVRARHLLSPRAARARVELPRRRRPPAGGRVGDAAARLLPGAAPPSRPVRHRRAGLRPRLRRGPEPARLPERVLGAGEDRAARARRERRVAPARGARARRGRGAPRAAGGERPAGAGRGALARPRLAPGGDLHGHPRASARPPGPPAGLDPRPDARELGVRDQRLLLAARGAQGAPRRGGGRPALHRLGLAAAARLLRQ